MDHGRGENADDWKHHGIKVKNADQIWMAAIGAGVKPKGEVKNIQRYQNQIAKTIAQLLGKNFTGKNVGESFSLN